MRYFCFFYTRNILCEQLVLSLKFSKEMEVLKSYPLIRMFKELAGFANAIFILLRDFCNVNRKIS